VRVRGRRVGEWGVATPAVAGSGVASRMRGDGRGGGTRSGEEDAMEGERRGKEKQKLREREGVIDGEGVGGGCHWSEMAALVTRRG